MSAEVLLKATKVDGIYDKDPQKHPDAKKFSQLSFSQALAKNLKFMDGTALALCRENKIPVYVFDLFEEGSLRKAVTSNSSGSLVTGE